MRQIELVGPVDKRVIAYPLFKICDVLGKVLVITDDANFRRFSENYSDNEFTVGRSDFVITPDISKAIIEELGLKLSSYDYVLIISTNSLISGNDSLVYCHGSSQLICSEDTLDGLEAVEHQDVTISMKKPNSKDALFLSIDGKAFNYVWDCEENKMFIPCKHPELAKLSSYLFAQVLGVSSKEEYAKLLVKEV